MSRINISWQPELRTYPAYDLTNKDDPQQLKISKIYHFAVIQDPLSTVDLLILDLKNDKIIECPSLKNQNARARHNYPRKQELKIIFEMFDSLMSNHDYADKHFFKDAGYQTSRNALNAFSHLMSQFCLDWRKHRDVQDFIDALRGHPQSNLLGPLYSQIQDVLNTVENPYSLLAHTAKYLTEMSHSGLFQPAKDRK